MAHPHHSGGVKESVWAQVQVLQRPKRLNSKISAVVLDVGGVVLELDWDRPLSHLGVKGTPAGELVRRLYESSEYDAFERGTISISDFVRFVQRHVGIPLEEKKFLAAFESLIVGPIEGIERALSSVREKARLATLSNTNSYHWDYCLRNYSLFDRFHHLFASFQFGLRKPEKAIYLKVAEHLSLPPSQILFIDDNLVNVEGARQAELHGEHSINSTARLEEIFCEYGLM